MVMVKRIKQKRTFSACQVGSQLKKKNVILIRGAIDCNKYKQRWNYAEFKTNLIFF